MIPIDVIESTANELMAISGALRRGDITPRQANELKDELIVRRSRERSRSVS